MSLKEILSIVNEGGILPNITFRTPRVKAARLALAKKFTEAEDILAAEELEIVALRLEAAAKNDDLKNLRRRDWNKAAWCLWLPGHELAKNSQFLSAYLRTIQETNRRSLYKKLISAYLRDYGSRKANIREIGQFLARGVVKFDWVWKDRQQKYRLFNEDAPNAIAATFAKSNKPYDEFLGDFGLSGGMLGRGMAASIYLGCLLAQKRIGGEAATDLLDRILKWSVDGDRLRYPGAEGVLADALLVPWQNANPTKAVQTKIEDFLLEHYKDPRFPTAPGTKWAAVKEDTKQVLLRWLVGAALQQFLQVVDKVAMPTQWKYRKAFWLAYYNRGVIDEAWVAFAWDGQLQARKSFGTRKGFGELNGPGIQNDHAVLVMRMGDLIIADWSHNGKCHIWTSSNKYAPRLYQKSYNKHTLTRSSSNKGVIHSAARHGNWQGKVASYIGTHTGLRLTHTDYMPRTRR